MLFGSRGPFLPFFSFALFFAAAFAQGASAQQFTQIGGALIAAPLESNGTTQQQGFSIAMSRDGNTFVLGGNSAGGFRGSAFVFARASGGTWTQVGGKIFGTGSSTALEQEGLSVAISADGTTIAVGGNLADNNIGAVWIFMRNGNDWTQQAKVNPGSPIGNATMGQSVALSDDGNTLIAGGNGDNAGQGAAWVFTRSGGVWTQQGGKLFGAGATGAALQGTSVALSADGNTAAVGGSADNSNIGAVWIFKRSGTNWSPDGNKLVPSDHNGTSRFATSVALSADGATLVGGGSTDNTAIGATWVFVRSGGIWSQQGSKLLGSDSAGASVRQGSSVSVTADGNTLITAGPSDNASKGAVWVFNRSGTTWSQLGSKFVPPQHNVSPVSLSGDGYTFAGGAGGQPPTGASYVFGRPGLTVSPASNIVAAGNVGGPFAPPSFDYTLHATNSDVGFSVNGAPSWLTVASSGVVPANTSKTLSFTVNANTLAAGTYGPNTVTIANTTNGLGSISFSATLTVSPVGSATAIVSAVLPASRSVQVGTAATAFATIINSGGTTATNCGLGFGSSNPAAFKFQTTDPATNAVTGSLNAPANIAAGGAQSYVFAVTPFAAFDPADIPITAGCTNSPPATNVVGLNTLLLSASNSPVPDIVALAATAGNDGIVNVAGNNGAGAFAVATVNVGIAADITASADTGGAAVPVTISLCQTDPATGQCTSAIGPSVTTTIAASATPTFAIFVQGSGNVAFDPAHSRIFVRFKDTGGLVRGATSVAVRTQ